MRYLKFLLLVILFGGVIWLTWFFWSYLRGAGPAVLPPSENIAALFPQRPSGATANANTNEQPSEVPTDFPLTIPDGFTISLVAQDIPGARVMAFGPQGSLWVSQPTENAVTKIEFEGDRVFTQTQPLGKLNHPHGLAFDPRNPIHLYVAEEDAIVRFELSNGFKKTTVIALPDGGRHTTRTIAFGPDDKLYVSIGSSCNVCHEKDTRRAAVYTVDRDGANWESFSTGLRNSVFFDWEPISRELWATEMGRDFLGDDLPPDEINILKRGKNYGWPYCYGQNVADTAFDTSADMICVNNATTGSTIDLPAHSAPLGLAFIPEEGWPEEYWYDLLVAYHGSWNRTEPTGYKIVRYPRDASGSIGEPVDLVSGWLTDKDRSLGRPVDLLALPGGSLYISDDKAGLIYLLKAPQL